MESTYPEEYEKIKEYLPDAEAKKEIVEQIVRVHLEWDAQMLAEYPNIRKRGRTMTTEQDNVTDGSSMESYLRAELLTYSSDTLKLLWQETEDAYKKGENLLKQIITNETLFYGYKSLEECEKKC